MIVIKEISKSFGDIAFFRKKNEKVLNKISLKLSPGDFVEIKGENGSGKTTFLKIISGLIIQDQGDIHPSTLSKTYISSSERAFFWRLSLMENLKFFLNIKHAKYTKDTHELCLDLLKRFKLLDSQDKLFMNLSSGQKKKVAIISGLLNNSDIYLFDEITTSLDECSKKELINYLKKIKKNKIIIWATHDDDIDEMKTQTLLLKNGEIVNV